MFPRAKQNKKTNKPKPVRHARNPRAERGKMTTVKIGKLITIRLMDLHPDGSGRYLGGYIVRSHIKKNTRNRLYNAMMDGLEALALAHAVNGIKVERPAYVRGLREAIAVAESNATTRFFRTNKGTLTLHIGESGRPRRTR